MKNQIKLCVISSDYPSPGRPMYVFVEQLVKEMVSQGVEINVMNCGFLGENPQHNHQHGTKDAYNGTVYLLGNNERIGDDKNCHCNGC